MGELKVRSNSEPQITRIIYFRVVFLCGLHVLLDRLMRRFRIDVCARFCMFCPKGLYRILYGLCMFDICFLWVARTRTWDQDQGQDWGQNQDQGQELARTGDKAKAGARAAAGTRTRVNIQDRRCRGRVPGSSAQDPAPRTQAPEPNTQHHNLEQGQHEDQLQDQGHGQG